MLGIVRTPETGRSAHHPGRPYALPGGEARGLSAPQIGVAGMVGEGDRGTAGEPWDGTIPRPLASVAGRKEKDPAVPNLRSSVELLVQVLVQRHVAALTLA
jgi:hypothetical protein